MSLLVQVQKHTNCHLQGGTMRHTRLSIGYNPPPGHSGARIKRRLRGRFSRGIYISSTMCYTIHYTRAVCIYDAVLRFCERLSQRETHRGTLGGWLNIMKKKGVTQRRVFVMLHSAHSLGSYVNITIWCWRDKRRWEKDALRTLKEEEEKKEKNKKRNNRHTHWLCGRAFDNIKEYEK